MIEHKETMAISCLTTKSRQTVPNVDANAFHINDREELHLQYVACAFSVHKVYVINVAEDEQCNFRECSTRWIEFTSRSSRR